MNADGTGQRRVAADPVPGFTPDWSPDGARIAFAKPQEASGTAIGGRLDVHVMNADGTQLRNLTADMAEDVNGGPSWSPDGSKIAFSAARGGAAPSSSIAVMSANGSGKQRLTRGDALDLRPEWSPDGSRIVFVRNRQQLWTVNADGTGERRLRPGNLDRFPAWSPNGRTGAFTARSTGENEVYVMRADGTGAVRLTGPCIVPTVRGRTVSTARALLSRERCGVGAVRRAYSQRVKRGRVISQSPLADTRLAAGARVKLVISRGPASSRGR